MKLLVRLVNANLVLYGKQFTGHSMYFLCGLRSQYDEYDDLNSFVL